MMRICLDVSPAVHGRAGIGRYVHELAAALLASDTENDYSVFYNDLSGASLSSALQNTSRLSVPFRDKRWRLSVLCAQTLRISQERYFPGIELFHATDNVLPCLPGIRSVFTLYDLAFRVYPETLTTLNRLYLSMMMGRFLRAADGVIAVSEHSRRDALRLYGIEASKIHVVHGGVDARFRATGPAAVAAVRNRYGLPENYILFVGSIEPRKNLVTLLQAFSALLRQTEFRTPQGSAVKLVVAGKRGWLYDEFFRQLRDLDLEQQVLFPGFVPDDDLPAVYSGAACFVFPSWYEGFGLPVLEAMACGVPVICSNVSSLPEIAGDAALLVDPGDPSGLKDAMVQVLGDTALRGELLDRGFRQASRFTWQRAAAQTLDVYRTIDAGRTMGS